MSQIEFNELSSREAWRLNQFRTADLIRIGPSAIFPAWLSPAVDWHSDATGAEAETAESNAQINPD